MPRSLLLREPMAARGEPPPALPAERAAQVSTATPEVSVMSLPTPQLVVVAAAVPVAGRVELVVVAVVGVQVAPL